MEKYNYNPITHDLDMTGDGAGDVINNYGVAWNDETPMEGYWIQKSTLPSPSASQLGKVYQYIGETTAECTHNYFYECMEIGGVYYWQRVNVQPSGGGGGEHPYLSLERLRHYLYRVTFDTLPDDDGGYTPVAGACSAYVADGKLHRNFDFKYDNAASFIVRTKHFEGIAMMTGLDDGAMDDDLVAKLPYRVVDGRNNSGIMVSAHVLFNDWEYTGAGAKSIPLTRLPYEVLKCVKSMATISNDLADVLGNLNVTSAMGDYLLQCLVTDGTTTYAIVPPDTDGQRYELVDAYTYPKMTNFRYVARTEVSRNDMDMQDRPTGIERFNAMPCNLEDLRFTKAYESTDRLSEFIGIDGTTKASTDEELTAIYGEARAEYLARQRDGVTWQTMHSVVYGRKMERLCIQEDWGDNVISAGASAEGCLRYDEAQDLTTEQQQQAQDNIGLKSALDKKANKDGYYSQLTVGAAENLIGGNDASREFTEDTAGGSVDITNGIVRVERIKGNSIVWNQLQSSVISDYKSKSEHYGTISQGGETGIKYTFKNVRNNVFDNKFSLNNNKIYFIKNHIYCLRAVIYTPYTARFSMRYRNGSRNIKTINEGWGVYQYYTRITDDTDPQGYIGVDSAGDAGFKVGDYYIMDKMQVIDVTAMFGAGNEPATVKEFERMFPLDYYDYNEGQLLSLNPSGILTDGFNQYNHANPVIKVFPQQYYIGGTYTSIWFSKNADNEEGTEITPVDHLFTPSEYGYIHVEGGNATDTVVNLHWSGKRDGEYEPYWQSTRNIDIASIKDGEGNTLFPDGLCSVGNVNDEVTSTKAVKRIAKQTITGAIGDEITLVGCNLNATEIASVSDYGTLANGVLTLTAAVTNKDVLYELATPIEVTLTEPLIFDYRVSDFGTETLLPINTAIPVTTPIKMDVVYGLNVVDFVRNANKNYLTIEDSAGDDGSSFTNLRSALSSAFGIDIVPTYNTTNKRYTFAITDNRKVEVPESASATGIKGTWAEDDTHVYLCTDTDAWVKIVKQTW